MVERSVTVVNDLGLHARAAARFVKVASAFKSQIKVTHGSQTTDGKSILGLLLLAAARGTELLIAAEGPDEDRALDALAGLASRGFEDP